MQNQLKEGSGIWLIDVRSAAAYEAVHIEGSVNIPAGVLVHKRFPPRKTLILVDDALGQRAARAAADDLVKRGQERVLLLEGGLPGWRDEGLPLVETLFPVPGVTADELKWALAESIPIRLYDLRDEAARKEGSVRGSMTMKGKTLAEREEEVKSLLSGSEKKKDLAARIRKPQPVVLIFSAADDAESLTRAVRQGTNSDIRYLIGGYEATIADRLRKQQTSGACPTCPRENGK